MASLTNTKIKDTYDGLLKTTDNDALGGTYKLITDGLGNSSGVYLGTGGNVGIGAAIPDDGDLQIGDSNTSFNMAFAGPRTKFGYDGTNAVVQGGSSKGIKFCVNNNTFGSGEAMRIKDSNGYVGIGEIDPSKPLTINKDQSETAILVQSSDTGVSGIYLGGQSDSIKGGLILDNSDDSIQLRGYNNATRLFVKSDGKIGIGTTDPTKLIHIASQSAQSVITLQRTNTNTSGAIGALQWTALDNHTVASMVALGDGNNEGAHITFNTTSEASSDNPFGINERMRINSSGNVGIGTGANVDEKLHIQGSVDNDDIALKIENTFDDNSSATPPSAAIVFSTASNNGHIRVFGAPANTAANHKMDIGATASTSYLTFSPNGSEKMRIDSSGNVGIGTTDPDALIHTFGSGNVAKFETTSLGGINLSRENNVGNHSTHYVISFNNLDSEIAYIKTLNKTGGTTSTGTGYEMQFATPGSGYQTFYTNGSERMRIDSSGTVLVGKTSSSSTTTGVELNPIGLVQVTRNNNLPLLVNRTGTDGTVVSIRNDNATVGTISVSGSTTSYNETSDYRLKENVVDMTGALDKIEQLQPKRFNFISEETTVDGFIAHEVQSVIPEAVFGEKDAVDDEGNPEYQGIDKSKIVPLLVGAIKELKAEIEILKSQINS